MTYANCPFATATPAASAHRSVTNFAADVVSIRGYIPNYLNQDLTMLSAQRRVTKTFLLMEALKKAGYRVDEIDMVQDRRKKS